MRGLTQDEMWLLAASAPGTPNRMAVNEDEAVAQALVRRGLMSHERIYLDAHHGVDRYTSTSLGMHVLRLVRALRAA